MEILCKKQEHEVNNLKEKAWVSIRMFILLINLYLQLSIIQIEDLQSHVLCSIKELNFDIDTVIDTQYSEKISYWNQILMLLLFTFKKSDTFIIGNLDTLFTCYTWNLEAYLQRPCPNIVYCHSIGQSKLGNPTDLMFYAT